MTEPQRWLNSSDAPLGARELLEAAPQAPPLDPALEAQIASSIASATSATAGAAASSGLVTKIAIGAVTTALVAAGVYTWASSDVEPASPELAPQAPELAPEMAPEMAPSPVEPGPATPEVTAQPEALAEPEAEPPEEAAAPIDEPPAEPTAPTDTLAAEAELLQDARVFAGKDPQAVLRRVRRHAARYPRGRLIAEREVLYIEALTDLGRADEARARAERFERRFPGSAYLPRVQRAIGRP